MPANIETILGARNLIGMIQARVAGVPDDIMPPEFYRASRTCEGNRGTYWKVQGTRLTARLVQYGAPSKQRELQGVSEVPITLLHSAEHIVHEPATLQNLLAEQQGDPNGEMKQRLGLQTVSRQIATFGDLFKNLRVSAIYSALALGYIYWDAAGNLLPTSSGAIGSVDFGVPAAHQNQLDVYGTGALIDAKWSAATTAIETQVKRIIKAGRKVTGYPITTAFYGENIPKYFVGNNGYKEAIHGSSRLAEAYATSEIPPGTFGIKRWIPVSEAFYASAGTVGGTETLSDWFGVNQIVFTPDATPDWWEVLEGTYPVPSAFNIVADAMQQLQALKEVAGAFSYATIVTDPVSIKQVCGDTFLPVLKVPKAIFNATVEF